MGGLDEEVKDQIPTLAVSGFFTPKMAAEILEATDEEL